jgi:uncharacterized protein (DUF1800 family)
VVNRSKFLLLSVLAFVLGGCASVVGTSGPSSPGIFTLTVSPASANVHGNTTQQFAATTSDGSSPALTWSVNGTIGGSSTTGTISAAGLYSAPEFPPAQNAISITATVASNSKENGSSSVTLQNPVPLLSSVTPLSISLGAFSLNLNGAHFAPGAIVYFGNLALTTTRISSTQLTATGTATSNQSGTVAITVVNPDPGTSASSAISAQVGVLGISVNVVPATVNVRIGTTRQFSANVTGSSNTGVGWAVNNIAGGNDTIGTVTGNGNYTAPLALPTPNTVTVSATSLADATKTNSSAVTLQNPIPVLTALAPPSVTVGTFTLTLTGSGFVNGAVVNFGSQALATTFVSSTQLTATGTATAAQAGNVPVTVTNPNPGSTTSAAINLLVSVPNSNIKVTVAPSSVTLAADALQTFTATVAGTTNEAVTWSVNTVSLGNTTVGTIDINGNYAAPDNMPMPNTVTVTATSVADPTKSGNATVTIINPAPTLTGVTPATIGTGPFQLTLYGTGFVNTSTATFGGLPLNVTYVSPLMLTVIGSATAAQAGSVPIVVTSPAPGGGTTGSVNVTVTLSGTPISSASAVRFLEQSSFGPDTESVDQIQELGYDIYLQNQFAAQVTPYRNPIPNDSIYNLQQRFFLNNVAAGDQLRERVSLALNELWVVGADKVSDPLGYTNYLRTLNKDAQTNYLTIMTDITLTPAMGNYLDMVNNDAPAAGQHANENYAREIMQLFTLGLNQLNADGTPTLDTSGNPIPTYTQDDVMALGRVFTGWTYPTTPGMSAQKHSPSYYGGPMVAWESNHDMGAKTLLGQTIPGGQTAEADLTSALSIIFNHPNVGPFVAQQLILKLVTSNPSPAYVQRVATAFNTGLFVNGAVTYGSGTRGDMQATITAILMDPEARRGDDPATAVATDGKLREPIVMIASIVRAFHGKTDAAGFSGEADNMSEQPFYPPTVFNFFPPVSPIPGTTLNGPEFAIFNTATSLARVNFINDSVYGAIGSNTHLDFSPVTNAGSQTNMLSWLGTLFLHGPMPDTMNSAITTAMGAVDVSDTQDQAKAAIYLVTSSSFYQVQH